MTIESSMDGAEAPVLIDGKATGEMMAIKRVDDHHLTSVTSMNGQKYGESRGAFSPDFNKLTVEDEILTAQGGLQGHKQTEIWVRK